MSARTIAIIIVAGLVILEGLALYYEREAIEQALLEKTSEVLEENEAEISIDQVSFFGRDATVQGWVSTDAEKRKTQKMIEDVWDVRVVNNYLQVVQDLDTRKKGEETNSVTRTDSLRPTAPQESTLVELARFELVQPSEETIRMEGVFSDSVMQGRVLDMVSSSFPGFEVNNVIEIDSTIERPNWYASLLSIIPTVGLVNNPDLSISGDSGVFMLSGEVFGDIQRDVITADALKALGDSLRVRTSLVVAETGESEENIRIATLKARIQNLLATTRIQFALNTADLTGPSMEVLNEIAVLLNDAPDIQVEIQGHTDNTGSIAVNRALSQVRAESVRSYLISRGVSASRLTAVGYGPGRPVATNFTYEGRVTNRRVEFSLRGGS